MLDPLRDFPWLRRGYEQGLEKGEEKGLAAGLAAGRAKGQATSILTILSARGIDVDADVRRQIEACADLAQLDRWLRRALKAATATEVIADS